MRGRMQCRRLMGGVHRPAVAVVAPGLWLVRRFRGGVRTPVYVGGCGKDRNVSVITTPSCLHSLVENT
jgi:hypothetical protein